MAQNSNPQPHATPMMHILGAVQRGGGTDGKEKKTWWTRIGVAFQNRDGSWNLLFDYLPTRLNETTIQLRVPSPRDDEGDQDHAG